MPEITLTTWNLHGLRDTRGRPSATWVRLAAGELAADVLAVQEIDTRDKADALETIGSRAGLDYVEGPTLIDHHGQYGNALLAREIDLLGCEDISFGSAERRCVLVAEVRTALGRIRVLNTHLGLSRRERRHQIDRLLELIDRQPPGALAVMGDLNVWEPLGRALRLLDRRLQPAPARRTFPAFLPLLALDRIWVRAPLRVVSARVHNTIAARRASDHLPLITTAR